MQGVSVAQRYSEPPGHSHPYYPLRDMHSIEELSRKFKKSKSKNFNINQLINRKYF